MKSRKILTLMTTIVATAATANASPAANATKLTPPTRWASSEIAVVMIDNAPYMVGRGVAPVAMSWAEYGRYLGETQPLLGPDGRPGCGNVVGKGTIRDGQCFGAREKAIARRLATMGDRETAGDENAIEQRVIWNMQQALEAFQRAKKAK
jgi:hypothetical protein